MPVHVTGYYSPQYGPHDDDDDEGEEDEEYEMVSGWCVRSCKCGKGGLVAEGERGGRGEEQNSFHQKLWC